MISKSIKRRDRLLLFVSTLCAIIIVPQDPSVITSEYDLGLASPSLASKLKCNDVKSQINTTKMAANSDRAFNIKSVDESLTGDYSNESIRCILFVSQVISKSTFRKLSNLYLRTLRR